MSEIQAETHVKDTVFRLLQQTAPEADPASLSPDVNVRAALDIDSYDFLMFLTAVDEELGVEVPEADYGKLNTLNEIVTYLSARLPKS